MAMALTCALGCPGKPAAQSPAKASSTTPPPRSDGAPVDPDAPLGIAACDTYVDRYTRCMERMDEASLPSARAAFRQTRASWHRALRSPDGKTLVGEACAQALAAIPAVCGGAPLETVREGGARDLGTPDPRKPDPGTQEGGTPPTPVIR